MCDSLSRHVAYENVINGAGGEEVHCLRIEEDKFVCLLLEMALHTFPHKPVDSGRVYECQHTGGDIRWNVTGARHVGQFTTRVHILS